MHIFKRHKIASSRYNISHKQVQCFLQCFSQANAHSDDVLAHSLTHSPSSSESKPKSVAHFLRARCSCSSSELAREAKHREQRCL